MLVGAEGIEPPTLAVYRLICTKPFHDRAKDTGGPMNDQSDMF